MSNDPNITPVAMRPDARFKIQTVRTIDVRMDHRSDDTLGKHLDSLLYDMQLDGFEVNKVTLEVNPEL